MSAPYDYGRSPTPSHRRDHSGTPSTQSGGRGIPTFVVSPTRESEQMTMRPPLPPRYPTSRGQGSFGPSSPEPLGQLRRLTMSSEYSDSGYTDYPGSMYQDERGQPEYIERGAGMAFASHESSPIRPDSSYHKYRCELCDLGFSRKKDLTSHQLVCTGTSSSKKSKRGLIKNAITKNIQRLPTGSAPQPFPPEGLSPVAEPPSAMLSPRSSIGYSDDEMLEDERKAFHKIIQMARDQVLKKDAEGEPPSPTRRRKPNLTARFAKSLTANVLKAVETGLIKIDGLADEDEDEDSLSHRAFHRISAGKSTKTKKKTSEGTFACPYAKGAPGKYIACNLIHRKDLPGLREHLRRKHFSGGAEPYEIYKNRDWEGLFRWCFKNWRGEIPSSQFDYVETVNKLLELNLAEPINSFLRDLERNFTERRSRELKDLQRVYDEQSWDNLYQFLENAKDEDSIPSEISPENFPPEPYPIPGGSTYPHPAIPSPLQPETVTLAVCLGNPLAYPGNEDTYQFFDFPLYQFSGAAFVGWVGRYFMITILPEMHNICLPEYGQTFSQIYEMEDFLNNKMPARLRDNHQGVLNGNITVVIKNPLWHEYLHNEHF